MQEQKAILMLVGVTLQQKKNLVSVVVNSEQHYSTCKGLAGNVFRCHAGLQSPWWC